ncbi:adenylyl cyclase X E isoform X3 [Drosophila ananassae]|nr:adenylyl cyclase X E isoform X3 [Drosophila ananassae]
MPLVWLLSFRDNESYYFVHSMCSWITGILLSLMDITKSVFRKPVFPLVPCYDHLVILSVYTMLPVAYQGYNSIYLGAAVSIIYISFVAWSVDAREASGAAIIAYSSYLVFLNLVLVFFICAREYRFLRVILTRFQLVFQNIALKAVMKKEKDLLESILPRTMVRTLQEDVKTRLQDDDNFARSGSITRKLYIEPFPEVSILVADMVNYTYLTTTLEASDLVEILHELFVNFDLAAKRNRSLRIKFLGDAYNCVAGIPTYFPTHANSCVDQALEMISITKDLSHRRHLSINLRIGVHSGELLAGIIGRIRWQFDIWSKDVDITNRLEVSGRPGMVHVSARTLRLLDDQYLYEEGTEEANQDPILKKAMIHTYLISGRVNDNNYEFTDPEEELVSSSSVTSYRFSLGHIFDDIETKTVREMVHEVEKLPVGREDRFNCKDRGDQMEKLTERYMFNGQVHFLIPIFRSWKREQRFHNQPDNLISYSMALMFLGGLVIFVMGTVDISSNEHLPILVGLLLTLFVLCFVAAYKKLWLQNPRHTVSDYPSFFLSLWLFKLSQLIEDSVFFRSALVIQGVILLYTLTSLRVFACDIAKLEVEIIVSNLLNEHPLMTCFMPWSVTYGVTVILFILLIIDGFPFFLKLIVGAILVASHLGTIHAFYGLAFERSESTFEGLRSDYAHTWYLLSFFIIYALLGRHLAYIKKSCFFMRLRYEDKLKETTFRTHSMKIIMANILPAHVAEVFKERNRHDQLYYENFDKVAVMFASIENCEVDTMGLRALHEFICFFDDLLATYHNKYKIEKIKVMGWTYMVACGLEVDHGADSSLNIPRVSELSSDRRRSNVSVRFGSLEQGEATSVHSQTNEHDDDDMAVIVMADFALGLLRIMRKIQEALKGNLKIGISHGAVMAGVVGLSKPYYDIWGHTVNMASRMTSTGVLNEIQVTLKTALVLRRYNIRCNFRGMTFVKGLGEVPTFLVALEQGLVFLPNHPAEHNQSDYMLFEKLSLRFAPSFVGPISPSSGVGLDEGEDELEEESMETDLLTGGSEISGDC